jgi:hypothetical protein
VQRPFVPQVLVQRLLLAFAWQLLRAPCSQRWLTAR